MDRTSQSVDPDWTSEILSRLMALGYSPSTGISIWTLDRSTLMSS